MLAPNNMFMTLAEAMVKGPARVFFRYLSYPIIAKNKIDEITRVEKLTSKERIRASVESIATKRIADLFDILPDGRGLFGLSFLSISMSYRSLSTMPAQ